MTDPLDLRLLAACAIVREAGQLAHDYFLRRDTLEIEFKGKQDLVSVADRAVEDAIRAHLTRAFPDDDLIGEEGGYAADRGGDRVWVIDPIDGTGNFLRGVPYWSVALAYVVGGRTELAVTYDPVHDELFVARRGHGASRNSRRIHVSDRADPGRSAIGTAWTRLVRRGRSVAGRTTSTVPWRWNRPGPRDLEGRSPGVDDAGGSHPDGRRPTPAPGARSTPSAGARRAPAA